MVAREMGFFKNLLNAVKGGSAYRPTLEAIPALTPVVAAMKQSNVQPALQLYNASGNDPELRHRLVVATADMFGAENTRTILLDAWVKNTPHDSFATLVRAKWRMDSAPSWRPNDPEDVADRARAANTEAAKQSLADYQRLAQAAPHDPVPWALMLALPLIFELDELRKLYGEVTRRAPGFFPAQLSMHHWLSAMWYGDHAQSVGFMREVAAAAPEGSDLHALVAYGHFRVYTYEKFYGDDTANAGAFLRDPATQQEVMAALGRSLWSPQYKPGYWSLWARHVAAVWFNEAGEKGRAKVELEKVGDAFDEHADPWNVSAATYAGIRGELGL